MGLPNSGVEHLGILGLVGSLTERACAKVVVGASAACLLVTGEGLPDNSDELLFDVAFDGLFKDLLSVLCGDGVDLDED